VYRHAADAWLPMAGATRSDDSGAQRRDAICAAAGVAIARKGLSATRIQDIAEAAGISTATVHYYFPSKDDVLLAAVRWADMQSERSLRGDSGDDESAIARLVRALEIVLPTEGILEDEYRLWLEIWSRAGHKPGLARECNAISERWFGRVRDIVAAGAESGEFHPVAPPDEIVERLIAVANGLGFKVVLGYPGLRLGQIRCGS
jgi:AcrR family transcriptional regulator